MTSTCPTGSRRRGRGARDSGTNTAVSTMAASTTGRLTRKIARQEMAETRKPPSTGPSAIEIPNIAPHTPMACARSRGSSKTLRMIDIATGVSAAPPIACTMRKTISSPRLGAIAHSSDPSPNSASPAWNTRRRPSRSAVEPASRSRLARTSV